MDVPLANTLLEFIYQYSGVFQYAHIVLTILTVKGVWTETATRRRAPLAAFLIAMVSCGAGGVITAILTHNKPPMSVMFKMLRRKQSRNLIDIIYGFCVPVLER